MDIHAQHIGLSAYYHYSKQNIFTFGRQVSLLALWYRLNYFLAVELYTKPKGRTSSSARFTQYNMVSMGTFLMAGNKKNGIEIEHRC